MSKQTGEIFEELQQGTPLDKALGFTPEAIDHIAALAADYYEKGRLEGALKLFAGLVNLRPDRAQFWSALGAVLTRLERHQEAVPVLNFALHLNTTDTAALVNRGECYMALGQVEKAGADFDRAIELDPREQDPASNRARQLVYGFARFFEMVHQQGMDQVEIEDS